MLYFWVGLNLEEIRSYALFSFASAEEVQTISFAERYGDKSHRMPEATSLTVLIYTAIRIIVSKSATIEQFKLREYTLKY